MTKTKCLAVLACLIAVSLASSTVGDYIQRFTSGATTNHAINATGSCSTDVADVSNTPYVSLWSNLYVTALGSDSARVIRMYRVSDFKGHFPKAWKTIDTVFCLLTDTLRTQSSRSGAPFFPVVSRYIQFKFTGMAGNSALTVIDSIGLCGYGQ